MPKLIGAFNVASTAYRLLMAVVGGFIFVSLFSAWLPQWLNRQWQVDVAESFLWCLLAGFAVYCGIIMWVVGTRKLLRTSVIVSLLTFLFWLMLTPVGGAV